MPISSHLAEIRSLIGNRLISLPAVTGIIKNDAGELLLVRNKGEAQWTIPGGIIEPNDRPAVSVVREMKEELNIDVKPVALLGVFGGPEYLIIYPNGDQVAYVTSVFECKILNGNPTPDKEEIEAASYFSPDKLSALDNPAWMTNLLGHLSSQNHFN